MRAGCSGVECGVRVGWNGVEWGETGGGEGHRVIGTSGHRVIGRGCASRDLGPSLARQKASGALVQDDKSLERKRA